MSNTRFSHGVAYGKYANFYARTDGLFDIDDTTPDVTLGNLFYTRNTGATAITYFDLRAHPSDSAKVEHEGKRITVVFGDTATFISPSSNMLITNSAAQSTIGGSMEFLLHKSAWIEVARNQARPDGGHATQAITDSAGLTDVTGLERVSVTVTSAAGYLESISGGTEGQVLQIVFARSGTVNSMYVNSDGNIKYYSFGSSAAPTAISPSGVYIFIKRSTNWWWVNPDPVAM